MGVSALVHIYKAYGVPTFTFIAKLLIQQILAAGFPFLFLLFLQNGGFSLLSLTSVSKLLFTVAYCNIKRSKNTTPLNGLFPLKLTRKQLVKAPASLYYSVESFAKAV